MKPILPEEVEAGKSVAGGFSRRQLAEWGIPWPPPKGWRRQLKREYFDWLVATRAKQRTGK